MNAMWRAQHWTTRVIAAGVLLSAPLSAQSGTAGQPPERILDCDRSLPGTGNIAGRLIADSAGIGVSRGVFSSGCVQRADSAGRFVLRGFPPGQYSVSIGDLGARRVPPATVRVVADSTTTVDFHLRPANLVLDCVETPRCAPILAVQPLDSALAEMGESDRLAEAGFRTTIAMAWGAGGMADSSLVYCLSGAGVAAGAPLLAAVQRRVPRARPASACETVPVSGGGPNHQERGTGLRAWAISIGPLQISGNTASSTSSYNVGMLWAAEWRCSYERVGPTWRATSCVMTRIS